LKIRNEKVGNTLPPEVEDKIYSELMNIRDEGYPVSRENLKNIGKDILAKENYKGLTKCEEKWVNNF